MNCFNCFKKENLEGLQKKNEKLESENEKLENEVKNLRQKLRGVDKALLLENQILKPVGEGRTHTMRNIFQMKGIKEQIDELLKPLKDDTLANTTYADDISRLMKAWENDIATLDKMGYPEVAKAFQEYDKFVSSGMLLWGTNVGKAAAQGELKQRGFQLVLDGFCRHVNAYNVAIFVLNG